MIYSPERIIKSQQKQHYKVSTENNKKTVSCQQLHTNVGKLVSLFITNISVKSFLIGLKKPNSIKLLLLVHAAKNLVHDYKAKKSSVVL